LPFTNKKKKIRSQGRIVWNSEEADFWQRSGKANLMNFRLTVGSDDSFDLVVVLVLVLPPCHIATFPPTAIIYFAFWIPDPQTLQTPQLATPNSSSPSIIG